MAQLGLDAHQEGSSTPDGKHGVPETLPSPSTPFLTSISASSTSAMVLADVLGDDSRTEEVEVAFSKSPPSAPPPAAASPPRKLSFMERQKAQLEEARRCEAKALAGIRSEDENEEGDSGDEYDYETGQYVKKKDSRDNRMKLGSGTSGDLTINDDENDGDDVDYGAQL